MHAAEEFSTSLDTTDSFEEIKFDSREEHITLPWNPFQKKYANVETRKKIDPLEEMEACFVERKMIKVSHFTCPYLVFYFSNLKVLRPLLNTI